MLINGMGSSPEMMGMSPTASDGMEMSDNTSTRDSETTSAMDSSVVNFGDTSELMGTAPADGASHQCATCGCANCGGDHGSSENSNAMGSTGMGNQNFMQMLMQLLEMLTSMIGGSSTQRRP